MERLTQRLRTGEVLMASKYEEKYTEKEWISVLQDRLAAYEDTGLEPREVSAIVKEWSDLCTIVGECGGIDRLRELAEADKDGRLVVHGLWIPIRESEMTGWQPELAGRDPIGGYVCSACKEESVFDCNDKFVLSNYCPNCGAKMDGGDGDAAD